MSGVFVWGWGERWGFLHLYIFTIIVIRGGCLLYFSGTGSGKGVGTGRGGTGIAFVLGYDMNIDNRAVGPPSRLVGLRHGVRRGAARWGVWTAGYLE